MRTYGEDVVPEKLLQLGQGSRGRDDGVRVRRCAVELVDVLDHPVVLFIAPEQARESA